MSDGSAVVFTYDGSYKGFLSLVFDAFSLKVMPSEIYTFDDMEPSLLKVHTVITDEEHWKRVENAISNKLGKKAEKMIQRAFLYGECGKEAALLRYIKRGFDGGMKVLSQIGDLDINRVYKMVVSVNNEANALYGFVRFEEVNGALLSVIHPKHYVLPLLGNYFKQRIRNEVFMIYDENHGAAFIHKGSQSAIVPVESLEKPEEGNDSFYVELWKTYYGHIAIDSRYNPRCRLAHMPKRFWEDLPEVKDELDENYRRGLSMGNKEDIKNKLESEKKERELGENKKISRLN